MIHAPRPVPIVSKTFATLFYGNSSGTVLLIMKTVDWVNVPLWLDLLISRICVANQLFNPTSLLQAMATWLISLAFVGWGVKCCVKRHVLCILHDTAVIPELQHVVSPQSWPHYCYCF